MTDPTAALTQWQDQTIAALKAQQDAYLDAVKTWRAAAVNNQFPAQAPESAAPFPTALPTPADIAEANKAFVERFTRQQQEFLTRLTNTFNTPAP